MKHERAHTLTSGEKEDPCKSDISILGEKNALKTEVSLTMKVYDSLQATMLQSALDVQTVLSDFCLCVNITGQFLLKL